MSWLVFHPSTRIWLVLLALTVAGFFSAEYGAVHSLSVAVIMALSAIKARLVLYRFMELGDAPVGLRIFFNIWLAACTLMIVGLYLLALN